MQTIVTLDIGTTAVKACLFDAKLRYLSRHAIEYTLKIAAPNIAEMNPDTYWKAACEGVMAVLSKAGVSSENVACLGITSQGETLIPIDEHGNPTHPAIVWLDARAGDEAEALRQQIGDAAYYKLTGLPTVSAADPICKLMWMKNRTPEVWRRTRHVLLLADYLAFRFTGRIATEPSLASSTGWLNTETGTPSVELLGAAGIELGKLPTVQSSGSIVGGMTKTAASACGLPTGTPVVLTAMDQICAAVGAGNLHPGHISETNGTALALTVTMDSFQAALSTGFPIVRHAQGGFAAMPYCPTGGMVLKWFKDNFCREEMTLSEKSGESPYALLDEMAMKGTASEKGLFLIPHFAGKVAPTLCEPMRGTLVGLTLDTTKSDVALAILEAIAFALRENVEALSNLGLPVKQIVSIGGGSQSALWQQIKANVLGRPVFALAACESTSLGAAALCAVALGFFTDLSAASQSAGTATTRFAPDPSRAEAYDLSYREYLRLDRAMRDWYSKRYYNLRKHSID